ncbi:methyltransferase domain-containing protein [Geovibrio thiophilus]|uniref:Methyltransferase domain-containing protein n=1 Tax=Geovibrio thiophilus TaxID=139438 RepID=A0A410JY04_9BACT|nr:methyltransferase domain-containing protein [Geovibrio thiophilus]QAR32945.1 methyltransferase domain-containing protein [Geovibrio thiophilus]
MKIHIKRFFDKAADCYDSSADIQKIAASKLIDLTEAVAPQTAIEIGTGSGIFTEMFLAKCRPEKFIGLDIAYSMSKASASFSGLFIQADGERLPFGKECADVLVSSSVLQWFQQPEVSVPAALETLKKDGRFYFSVFCDGTFTEMAVLNRITGFGSVYPLKTAEFYDDLFGRINGITHRLEIHDYVLRFPDVKEFLKKQKATGARFTGRTAAAGKDSYRRFCELYESFFGDGETVPVTYRIAYITGKRTHA